MLATIILESFAALLGFSARSSAAEHESDSILDRALTFLHRPTPAARPHSFSSLSRTPPNALRHLHPLKREVGTASPAFERARMAFQFASAGTSGFGNNAGGTSNAQTQTGPDLEEIQTEALGFQSIAGESKVRLLPSPWPSNALPPPTASLLSIASRKGLLAAAGPDSVILASTESVRQAFSSGGEGNPKSFTPQLILNLGIRVSQVAFSADEDHLIISAEQGGGLAVYNVQALMQGNTEPAFELPTNNIGIRSLVPNPTAEKAELVAVVTSNGGLMMANLQTREFCIDAQGLIMKEGVSCVSWSNKGKQLVAGLGDGTCLQLTPEGLGKAEIPKPLALEGDQHVSSILWLENNIFLVAHTPTSYDAENSPASIFHLISRQPSQNSVIFQKLPEVCAPFGLNRSPPNHFIQRLKDFPPGLQDLILVASTASDDVGLFSRSTAPLSSDLPPEQVTNVFTTTTMANDSRRAILPMAEDLDLASTSPIGTALDLSAKENVPRPLPGEEMDSSPGPLPALMVLNHEGILVSWWIVYAESIRQGTAYPGLVAEGSQTYHQSQTSQPPPVFGAAATPTAPAFGQAGFGTTASGAGLTSLNKPSGSLFGGAKAPSAIGGGPFGNSSALGTPQSPWTTSGPTSGASQAAPSSFGKPSFGAPATVGGSTHAPAFGTTGGLGKNVSPWATPSIGGQQTGGSVFGQSGSLGMRSGSAFAGASATNPFGSGVSAKSPFASFTQGGGFAQAAAQVGGESPFAKAGTAASFESTMATDTNFGGTPQKKADTMSTSGFKLGSTFVGDGSAKVDDSESIAKHGGFGFAPLGSALDEARNHVSEPQMKETNMEDDDSSVVSHDDSLDLARPEKSAEATAPAPASNEPSDTSPPKAGGFFGTQTQQKTTPAAVQNSAPAPSLFDRITPRSETQPHETQPPKVGGLFSTQAQGKSTPAAVQTSAPVPSIFGNSTSTTTPQSTPQKAAETPKPSDTPPSPPIKAEPDDSQTPTDLLKSIPEAPLPPESTSKTAFAPGDSSNSSKSSLDDAPLPPDWTPVRTKLNKEEKPPSEGTASPDDAPLPPDYNLPKPKAKQTKSPAEEETALPSDEDDEGWDDEGSGVDVAQEIGSTTGVTPESSFGASFERSPLGELFSKVPRQPARQKVTSLFGELGQPSAPYLPPPTKSKESPRSPSPVRSVAPTGNLRAQKARSVSPASRPPNFMNSRKPGAKKTTSTLKTQPSVQQQRQRDLEAILAQRTKRQEEEEQDLSDCEDERVREELEADLEATKTLDDFVAHQDYVGNITKPGIPGQIEKVYRDINSMVDTLGLNARSLEAFVRGHSELAKNGGRSMEDLDNEDWCLIEIADLGTLEENLKDQLFDGRLQDIQQKLDVCRDMRKDLAKLQPKRTEIKRYIDFKGDREQQATLRAAPLSTEYAEQQHMLRKKFASVQKLIAEVEESITLLRTSLASHDTSNSQGTPLKRPTVEAVTNTILKMTSMIEKKSGDIDVLENQMRKLRFSSINRPTSRDGSPFNAAKSVDQLSSLMNATSLASGAAESPGSTFRRSTGDRGTPRKRMSAISPEEVSGLRAKTKRRKEVSRMVQEAFLKTGPRVRPLD